jgi:hypothetical protein
MTQTNPTDELLAKLRQRTPTTSHYLYGTEGGDLVNPDGPEAADTIDRLQSQVDAYQEALERIENMFPKGANDMNIRLGTARSMAAIARQALNRSAPND